DVVILNDPFSGGTHLPDITLVAPVYVAPSPNTGFGAGGRAKTRKRGPDFYVASRAHHADVGGTYPGSMGPCREIFQEGFRIPPVKLMRAGQTDRDVLTLLLHNVRTPEEREGDLGAQIAACHTGETRLRELCARYGLAMLRQAAKDLHDYSEGMMRSFLGCVPAGSDQPEEFLSATGVPDQRLR